MKPCDMPCPKCGSVDIHRTFRQQGDNWKLYIDEPHKRNNEFAHIGAWTGSALKDCIIHHCRCCQWEWDTPPLKSRR